MRSCISFSDLGSGNLWDLTETQATIPRGKSVSENMSDIEGDGSKNEDPPLGQGKKIIVANFLPLHAQKDLETGKWCFSFDDDSLLLHLKESFYVVYVGSLPVDVDASEQDEVAEKLLEEFSCVPTFLPSDLQKKFYHGFCKQYLWSLLHYMLPLSPDYGNRFDRVLWKAYISANEVFADKVLEVINPTEDYVWIQDYHLMILPNFLRRRYNRVKIGFFLHSPFPSSEIYRTLPVKEEILKALLNADLVGFQTYDYARHFLSCCSRILGLDYESKRGHIGVEYFGRTVYIKILPAGIHMNRLETAVELTCSSHRFKEIQEQFKGKKLFLGIDDMDIFKGISLKLLAVEQLLMQHPNWQGNLVFVQIVNPARSIRIDTQQAKRELYETTIRINETYGSAGYVPVLLIDRPTPVNEKIAYCVLAECCVVNAVRDGLNLIPYKYIVCRQGTPKSDEDMGIAADSPHTSTLVVSEFVGCSPSLSGAIRVNPWDIDSVAEALNRAIMMTDLERQLQHEKHYRYVSFHDVAYWAHSFVRYLERACKDHYNRQCWGLGFGLNYRVLSLPPNFRKLSIGHVVSSYKKTERRAILLDYDGTLVPQDSLVKSPGYELISILSNLCSDPKNTVFIVSGRGRNSLGSWFATCENLGIVAEHGYFKRWNGKSNWESSLLPTNFDWKRTAFPIMKSYTESTDGSSIETKASALVWHHQDADSSFGSCQAKELLDHLEDVLANEPVVVVRGQHIVEVKPQGVSKGLAAEEVLSKMIRNGKPPDFVMCIGDDRSDEDMFESISSAGTAWRSSMSADPEIFACTVGQKPSKATYYLDETSDVLRLLQGLAAASSLSPSAAQESTIH